MFRMTLLPMSLVFLVFSLPLAAMAGPSLEIEEKVFDFGRIFQGEKIRHVYRIRNAGDAPLVVEKIKTSCGCTAALLSEKTLLPGQTSEVTANFDSGRFSGPVKKTIYLYSNDPAQAVTKLFIQGEITPEISVRPEVLQLGAQRIGTTTEEEIEIVNVGSVPLALNKVETTHREVTAKVSTNRVPPGEKAVIQVTIQPKEGVERITAYILVETDNPRHPMLRIPVFAKVID